MENQKFTEKMKMKKKKIFEDLRSLERSGVFSVVIECTVKSLVDNLINSTQIPLIGIGASEKCRGQIIVTEDILGMTNFSSKFSKKYFDFLKKAQKPIELFVKDVKNKRYPKKNSMLLISDPYILSSRLLEFKKKGRKISFIPTMGNLHKGHLKLIREGKKENFITLLSIFVNPLQFNDINDYKNYPRTLEQDKKLAFKEGIDILFNPNDHFILKKKII